MVGFWSQKKLDVEEELKKVFPNLQLIDAAEQAFTEEIETLFTDCDNKAELRKLSELKAKQQSKLQVVQISKHYDTDILNHVNQFMYWHNNTDLNSLTLKSTVKALQCPTSLFFVEDSMQQLIVEVSSSEKRQQYTESVLDFIKPHISSTSVHKKVAIACEEMLTNIIYDAALEADPAHASRFKRNDKIELKPEEVGKLIVSCNSKYITLTTMDPWASFKKEKFIFYTNKVHNPDDINLIDTKESGAGLGLFRLLNIGSGMACKVFPTKHTEFSLLIEAKPQKTPVDEFNKCLAFYTCTGSKS